LAVFEGIIARFAGEIKRVFGGVGDGRGHEHGFGADGSVARLDVEQRVIFELPAVELGLALKPLGRLGDQHWKESFGIKVGYLE
jgi:hypothetical protein